MRNLFFEVQTTGSGRKEKLFFFKKIFFYLLLNQAKRKRTNKIRLKNLEKFKRSISKDLPREEEVYF